MITTLPCLQGRCYFAYKGVGQLTYNGVLHDGTLLQASDKQHSFQPRFLTINHSNSTFSKDIFLLIRELPISTPLQANRLLPYKQGYVVYQINRDQYTQSVNEVKVGKNRDQFSDRSGFPVLAPEKRRKRANIFYQTDPGFLEK
ncbi:Hypothetical_protein [Hexamita inflata]|uniref:Hypothetical_protein n=1 Tax=Hexamita inflata TaxID=28002 RepID=A0AA86RIX6_9EUKA|nr:Hypothetical protein HINF_LOCUS62048 [Hexamita inflata]